MTPLRIPKLTLTPFDFPLPVHHQNTRSPGALSVYLMTMVVLPWAESVLIENVMCERYSEPEPLGSARVLKHMIKIKSESPSFLTGGDSVILLYDGCLDQFTQSVLLRLPCF